MDATAMVSDWVRGYLATADGAEFAKKAIHKVLQTAIESATGHSSEFRKRVDAAMLKAIQLHEDICIASYNDAILKIIERQLDGAVHDAIDSEVAGRMKELLQPVPASIKLSKLAEDYREYLKDKSSSGCFCHGESVMTFVKEEQSTSGFVHYGLDDEPNKSIRKCEIQFGLYKSKVYSLTFDSSEIEKRLFVGPIYGFHRTLFQMKAAQTEVVIDCEPGDVELDYGQED